MSERLLRAGTEQGRGTRLFRRGIRPSAAAVYKPQHFAHDKLGPSFFSVPWHFSENYLERGLGEKICTKFVSEMMGAWWLARERYLNGSKMGKKEVHPLPLTVAENTVAFLWDLWSYMIFYRTNLRYNKKKTCLTRSRVDTNNSNFV